jgi:MutS domain V
LLIIANIYRDQIAACTAAIRQLQNKLNGLSLLRLLLFVALCFTVYALKQGFSTNLFVLTILLAAGFIACINVYYNCKEERGLLEKLRFVSTNELDILAGQPNTFPDGAAYLDNDNYLDDLDIFGRRSLFHTLNRTTTARGSVSLADRLRQPLMQGEEIVRQQDAIRALTPQAELRRLLTATGLVMQETNATPGGSPSDLNTDNLRKWLDTPPRIANRIALRVGIALVEVFSLYAIYQLFASNTYTLVLLAFVVCRLVQVRYLKYIGQQHQLIGHNHKVLDQFAGILAVFNKTDTKDSVVLRDLRTHTGNAHTAIRRLSRLTNAFDQRLNLLVNLLLSNFFFYDLHCMIGLERWKAANRAEFLNWLDAVATVERLNSLATFAFNNPDNNYPEPIAAATAAPQGTPAHVTDAASRPSQGTAAPGLFIEATGLAHPLIPAARRIANDLSIGHEERLILVTGSNMSGKTTFLRTLGVNLLMAQCGLPVCAASFVFTPMQLLTSLRISDSLQDQTSYFMAELKKLQKIIRRLETGAPALVLIDEILRGTNSEDKTYGSEQFIRKLLQYHCLSLFATHDLSLGQLEQTSPGALRNYCFESVIESGELHFDYRLQRGIARNRNASFLMQKMNII